MNNEAKISNFFANKSVHLMRDETRSFINSLHVSEIRNILSDHNYSNLLTINDYLIIMEKNPHLVGLFPASIKADAQIIEKAYLALDMKSFAKNFASVANNITETIISNTSSIQLFRAYINGKRNLFSSDVQCHALYTIVFNNEFRKRFNDECAAYITRSFHDGYRFLIDDESVVESLINYQLKSNSCRIDAEMFEYIAKSKFATNLFNKIKDPYTLNIILSDSRRFNFLKFECSSYIQNVYDAYTLVKLPLIMQFFDISPSDVAAQIKKKEAERNLIGRNRAIESLNNTLSNYNANNTDSYLQVDIANLIVENSEHSQYLIERVIEFANSNNMNTLMRDVVIEIVNYNNVYDDDF